jgi:hypothetical protein
MNETLLWLFVINLGVAFGAGLYEHRITVPRWITSLPESGTHWHADSVRSDDPGRRFWGMVTTVPLTLLTLANLYAALFTLDAARGWWIAACLFAVADRAVTFGYFIPAMVGLMKASDSSTSAAAATRWSRLNYVRHAVVLAAWLASLQAFRLLGR